MSRLISRDPFARTELHRFIWAVRSDQTCDNYVINPGDPDDQLLLHL